MVTPSKFQASSSLHLSKLSDAFNIKGDQASIETRKKQLLALLAQQMKSVEALNATSSKDKQQKITDLAQDLALLKNKTEELAAHYPHLQKAQDLSKVVLEKIADVSSVLDNPSHKPLRRIFRFDEPLLTPTESSPSLQHPQIKHREQTDKDLKIQQEDLIAFDKEAAKQQGIQGFLNKGGNDCFQNALCQALLTKKLKKDIIDRLPNVLRQHFYTANGIHSQQLRKALQKTEIFNHPLTTQEDAHELFKALIAASDQQFTELDEPASPLKLLSNKPRTIDLFQSFIEKRNVVVKALLLSFFIPLKLCLLLGEKILSALEDDQENDIIDLTPSTYETLPPRTLAASPNSLKFALEHYNRWDVSQVAKEFKHHDYFGGANNTSEREEPVHGGFEIGLENDDPFNLQQTFYNLFNASSTSEATVAMPLDKGYYGPASLKTFSAPCTIRKRLKSIPEAFCLSINRFENIPRRDEQGALLKDANGQVLSTRQKKFNPAINFSTELAIDPQYFKEDVRPAEAVKMHLQSFVVHKGSTPASGHYVAFRKVEGDWYYFDDSRCEKVKEEAALRAAQHAYMYFFEKA
jgi:hypothetical protein